MNAARLDRSPRLQRVLDCLQRGGWWTTRQLIQYATVCAVNSCIAELRANGIPVESDVIYRGGRRIWRYRLAEGEAE